MLRLAAFGLALMGTGCQKSDPVPTPSATASGTVPLASSANKPRAKPLERRLPTGPRLAILAGKGVGPIRIGATIATIERIMAAPCDTKTETLCRYVDRAVEMHLEKGVTTRIHVHRPGRQSKGETKTYGFFNGSIPPDLYVGMLPWAIQEKLGKPQSVEKLSQADAHGTVERHHYPGLELEYDRNPENDKLILGGIIVVPLEAKKP